MTNLLIGPATLDRRTLVRWAGLGLATMIAQPARGAAAPPVLRLPPPTGRHPVGVTEIYLVDRSRRDPWIADLPVRELMLSVFYPAGTVRGFDRAPHMSPAAATVFAVLDVHLHPGLPTSGVDWGATLTHARTGAPVAPGRWPVLLYSPGGADPRTLGTTLAEDLAGHGFVVVTVDHPGDASEVEFPTTTDARQERVRTTVFRADPRTDARTFATMIEARVADLGFVLDQVTVLAAGGNPDALGRALPTGLGQALALDRLGVLGHSAGGTAAAVAMSQDRRFRAAVDLEGYLDLAPDAAGAPGDLYPIARDGSDRPLLLVGTELFHRGSELERSWSAVLSRSAGRARRTQVDNAAHWVFTDFAALVPQLQGYGMTTQADRDALVGPLPAARSVPRVRHLVRSFLARHL